MSTPVVPVSLIMFKMVRGYEKTHQKQYSKSELFRFAHYALKIAGEIDNEEYWIVSANKYGIDYCEKMSKICDMDLENYYLNEDKLNNGGKEYAERIIGAMPYSFLKGAIQTMEELENEEEASLCD